MSLLEIIPPIPPDMRAKIETELEAIQSRENVRIIFAIESGSRAWGFPSPDSDYDVRFVYAHPADRYLTLVPGRDVIELPIERDLDINGWDIRKALNLLLKPNPVLLEWLSSPLRYLWDDAICQRLVSLAAKTTHGTACLHHYLKVGERQLSAYIQDKERVNLKKYLYVIRPAMVVRWIRLNPNLPPPMNFQALLSGAELSAPLTDELADLLDRKSQSKELGDAPPIALIDDFIKSEFDWAREAVKKIDRDTVHLQDEADMLFRSIIKGEAA
jgi:hypothetical protein